MSNTQDEPADHQMNLEADANAALIAAAPALLAACKAALGATDGVLPGRVWITLRAAVRLAEGGAQ